MQEQIDREAIGITLKASRFTAKVLAKALLLVARKIQKEHRKAQTPHGKQSVKKLIGQGQGVSNIDITDGNIKSFERVARKYGVDFALKKDSSVEPPKWMVFFKAKDADALTAAFKEFTGKTLKRQKTKASLTETVKKFKEVAKELAANLVKNKSKGREER